MIISDVLPVMVDDALLSSHPIIVNVSTPAEITSVFDSISYSKVKLPENVSVSRIIDVSNERQSNNIMEMIHLSSGSIHSADVGGLDG